MHEVKLFPYSLPLVREVGHMVDTKGDNHHPNRKMEKINVFVYVKKGTIHVVEDNTEYHLKEGTYLFLRKNLRHWGEEFYAPGTEWYYIHFYDPPIEQASEKMKAYSTFQQSSMIVEDVYLTEMNLPKQGEATNKEYAELQLEKMLKQYETIQLMRPLQLSTMAYQFFAELYIDSLNKRNHSKSNWIVGQMIDLFGNSSARKLSSKEITEAMGMNYAYLSTLFKAQTGKSITQFQNELLIEKAINLLKSSSKNIAEVSDILGFSNPYYFSRVFKKVTGVSPSMYLTQNYR